MRKERERESRREGRRKKSNLPLLSLRHYKAKAGGKRRAVWLTWRGAY